MEPAAASVSCSTTVGAVSPSHDGPNPTHPTGSPASPGVQGSGAQFQVGAAEGPSTAAGSTGCFNPVAARPYPKAGEERRGQQLHLTGTPTKRALEEEREK